MVERHTPAKRRAFLRRDDTICLGRGYALWWWLLLELPRTYSTSAASCPRRGNVGLGRPAEWDVDLDLCLL